MAEAGERVGQADLPLVDASAREAFAETQGRHLRRVVARHARRYQVDVEDVVQETLTEWYASAADFTSLKEAADWCERRAVALCRTHSRRRRLEDLHHDVPDRAFAPAPDAAEEVLHRLDVKMAMTALREGPPRQQCALVATTMFGLSYEETARVLGVPVTAVGPLVARARAGLRDRYRKLATGTGAHAAALLARVCRPFSHARVASAGALASLAVLAPLVFVPSPFDGAVPAVRPPAGAAPQLSLSAREDNSGRTERTSAHPLHPVGPVSRPRAAHVEDRMQPPSKFRPVARCIPVACINTGGVAEEGQYGDELTVVSPIGATPVTGERVSVMQGHVPVCDAAALAPQQGHVRCTRHTRPAPAPGTPPSA